MEWKQVSKYNMTSGEWTISKALVGDSARYLLWRGDELMGGFDSADESKGAAAKWKAKK